jgi:hypothetical protein
MLTSRPTWLIMLGVLASPDPGLAGAPPGAADRGNCGRLPWQPGNEGTRVAIPDPQVGAQARVPRPSYAATGRGAVGGGTGRATRPDPRKPAASAGGTASGKSPGSVDATSPRSARGLGNLQERRPHGHETRWSPWLFPVRSSSGPPGRHGWVGRPAPGGREAA